MNYEVMRDVVTGTITVIKSNRAVGEYKDGHILSWVFENPYVAMGQINLLYKEKMAILKLEHEHALMILDQYKYKWDEEAKG